MAGSMPIEQQQQEPPRPPIACAACCADTGRVHVDPKTSSRASRLREFFGKIFSPEDVLSCHMVKREEEIAKLVSKRETLQQMKRKAELTYEKTQQVEMFRPSSLMTEFCAKSSTN